MVSLSHDTLLGERYQLTSRIAIGGMGEVWRAEDTLLHRTVAVKVLKAELSGDPSFIDRFRAEARTTASLSHPGIAGVYDYGEMRSADELPVAYLVMELVDGEPLSAILAAEGRLAVDRTLDIVGQAATALQAAHRTGMVHRDIKPGNLLVAPDGSVKITDFGIARVAYSVPLTEHGMVVGTAQYFSPEQAEGHVVGTASDIYSLGVVAFECLAGRLPFLADNPLTVALMQIRDPVPPLPPDVPPAARALVERCLAKPPGARYPTGGDLAAAVRAARAEPYVVRAPFPQARQPFPAAPAGPPRQGPLSQQQGQSHQQGQSQQQQTQSPPQGQRQRPRAQHPAPAPPRGARQLPQPIGPPHLQTNRRGAVVTAVVVLLVGALAVAVWLIVRRDEKNSSAGLSRGGEGTVATSLTVRRQMGTQPVPRENSPATSPSSIVGGR